MNLEIPARFATLATAGFAPMMGDPVQGEPTAKPTAVLEGRVVASDGVPVEGAHVQVAQTCFWSIADDEWLFANLGRSLPSPPEVPRIITHTDAEGRFRLEMEIPESGTHKLVIRAAPRMTREEILLGVTDPRADHLLVAGPQELGLFTLEPASEIRGVVTDQFAVPLKTAQVVLQPELDDALEAISCFTDDQGRYRIPHLPAGGFHISAAIELGGASTPPLSIRIERTLEPLECDLVVERSPRISGRCVDEAGAPIPGVQVGVEGSYRFFQGPIATGEDGEFIDVHAREPGPLTVAVWKEGYIPIGESAGVKRFESDHRDAVFVLREIPPRTTFRVVDIETGEPIEPFHIERLYGQGRIQRPEWGPPRDIIGIGGGAGGSFGGRFGGRGNTDAGATRPSDIPIPVLLGPKGEPKTWPKGTATVAARMGLDRIRVSTPGYLPIESEIVHVSRDDPSQTIHLSRGATVRGRWLDGAQPAAGIRVRIDAGTLEPESTEPGAPLRFKPAPGHWLETTTWVDGTFEIPGIDNGAHRITAWTRNFDATATHTFTVEDHGDVDLGDRNFDR